MSLSAVEFRDGAKSTWDWKQEYIERLANGDGLEMFSEASVTPDTTLILAGPCRVPDDGFQETLSPIGLITDVNFSSENGLRPTWEIGTTKTYFTRGKTSYQLSIGAMVANKPSLMKLMTRQSPQENDEDGTREFPGGPNKNVDHIGQFWTNMDTEYTAAPFGILMIFKTKGGKDWVNENYPQPPVPKEIPEYVPLDTSEYLLGSFGLASAEASNREAYDETVAYIEEQNALAYAKYEERVEQYDKDIASSESDSSHSSFVSAMYLENCNIGSFSFNINSGATTIQENVTIMFDRMVAVDYS